MYPLDEKVLDDNNDDVGCFAIVGTSLSSEAAKHMCCISKPSHDACSLFKNHHLASDASQQQPTTTTTTTSTMKQMMQHSLVALKTFMDFHIICCCWRQRRRRRRSGPVMLKYVSCSSYYYIQSKHLLYTPQEREKERERKKECHALQLPPIKSNLVPALTLVPRWAEAKSYLHLLLLRGWDIEKERE